MKIKYLARKIGGFTAIALLLTGLIVFSNTSAEAQRRFYRPLVIVRPYRTFSPFRSYYPFGYNYGWYNQYQYSQYVFDNTEDAQKKGYKDGLKTGKDDGKKDKSFNFERSHYYHDSGFGNYAEVYRNSFARGYQDGYREGQENRKA